MKDMIKFDMPKNQSSIIKVIGVGGGGSNAVSHMFRQGIAGVDFIICNTDAQAMETSPVPTKIQLGEKGLGAGSIPAVGKASAQQKVSDIRELLERNTQMLFITAGMGGGTGTGAAPVIASIAKELNILTVGIVTLPFSFEGRKRKLQAEEGIRELKEYVDTLLIISNDKIREHYGDLKLSDAFHKADDVLTTAAKGIAEIITVTGYINVDFEDVKTVMKESGKAIMGCAQAEGDNRALEAVKGALASPLLNDNDIEGAGNVLLYITSGKEEISMDEVTEITDYIQQEAKSQAEIIWGNGYDESLGNMINITLIATGFDIEKKKESAMINKIRHNLNDEVDKHSKQNAEASRASFAAIEQQEPVSRKYTEKVLNDETLESKREVNFENISLVRKSSESFTSSGDADLPGKPEDDDRTFVFDFSRDLDEEASPSDSVSDKSQKQAEKPVPGPESFKEERKPFEVYIKKGPSQPLKKDTSVVGPNELDLQSKERIERLKNLSLKLKTPEGIDELENQPAYLRKKVELSDSIPSEESQVSRYSLYDGEDGKQVELRSNNSFLHDNVD